MAAPHKKRKQLLIVENNPETAELLAIRLRSHKFEVHIEPLGSKALQHAQLNPPDLVILDLKLPDMSGHQVCQQLQEINQPWGIPILMLTDLNHPIDELRSFAYGANAYLAKPYDPEELLRTIGYLFGEASSSKEAA